MAGTTYHIIDKYVDTGEILHNNVPKLQGDGMQMLLQAVVEAHKDIDLIVRKIKKRINLNINQKKCYYVQKRIIYKIRLETEMLNIIYDIL